VKILTNLIVSLVVSAWIGIVSVFSIQNVTEISLKFLTFESIKLPVGVLLSFCLGFGTILGSIAPLLWQKPKSKNSKGKRYQEEDLEYLGKEDPLEDWSRTGSKNW
jgi:lipopolysaccharide assembly protein A